MATSDDTTGSDLPALSSEQEAAFAAEEAAANSARAGAKGLGHLRLAPDGDDGEEPAPTPAAPAAPAAPAPDPKAAAPAAPAAPLAPSADADDDVPDAVTDKDGKRYVPLALHIGTRKSLQGQLKDAQTIIEEGNKRLNHLIDTVKAQATQAPAAPAAAPPAPPAPETNPYDKTTHPLEHLEWENQQLAKQVKEVAEWRKTQETTATQTQAMREAQNAYVQMHRDFVTKNPAYDGAYKFVTDTWTKVNLALGMNQQEAIAAANQQEWAVVERAAKANQHPSAVIMEIAKAAGWQPQAPAAVPAGGAAPAGAAPAAPAAPSPQKQIELAQAGAAAAVSLSDAAGGSAPQAPTLAQIVAMPKEEFYSRFTGANGEAEFRKLAMGTKRGAMGA